MTKSTNLPLDAINDFAARWIASLPNEATVFSPVGVWPVLAILADAATDEVATGLRQALCFEPSSDNSLVDAAIGTLEFLRRNKAIDAAVGVWVAKVLGVKEAWLARLPEGARGLLTKTPADQDTLDDWTQQHTRKLFKEFPAKVTEDDDFLLASAIALTMVWDREFYRQSDGLLTNSYRGLDLVRSAKGVTVVRIRGDAERRKMRYGPCQYIDCYLVVGNNDAPAADVLSRGLALVREHGDKALKYEEALKLSGPGITTRVDKSYHKADNGDPFVTITTPGFKVSARHDLLDSDVFGLKPATVQPKEEGKHFPEITDSPLSVRGASQEAVARFHEKGFSAAAVTLLRGVGAARPRAGRALFIDVKIDGPFGFLCVEKKTGVVTFAGWVTEKEFTENDDDLISESEQSGESDGSEDSYSSDASQ